MLTFNRYSEDIIKLENWRPILIVIKYFCNAISKSDILIQFNSPFCFDPSQLDHEWCSMI